MKTTVYRYFDAAGELLYIGVTKNLIDRQDAHQNTKSWWSDVASASFVHFETRDEALAYEAAMIGIEFPKYNKQGAILPEEGREHLLQILYRELDDDFHLRASDSMAETMLELRSFSNANESYRLLFAFDRAMPWDDEGSEMLVHCWNCQKILDSSWYQKQLHQADSIICDQAAKR